MHIKNFDPYDFSKKEIEGVPVYYKNLPWAPCVHIQISFNNVGAFNDPVGKEGVSHFLEHLPGNGSPMLPDKKAIKEFSRTYMLNSRNAFTGYYRTAYVGRCLPENLEIVLKTMKDYIFNPFLRPEDVEHERKVITQEAWGRFRNEKYLKYIKEFNDNLFRGHQKSRIHSALGWPDTIAKISHQDILDYHKKNYVKSNLSVFLVGAIEEKHISLVDDFISGIPDGEKVDFYSGDILKPEQLRFEKNSEEIGMPTEQLDFSISRVYRKTNNKEEAVLDMVTALIQDLLFERLRLENSLCYGVSSGRNREKDFQIFGISVKTKEDNLSLSEKEIWNVINEIIDGKWEGRFNDLHNLTIDQLRSNERSSSVILSNFSENVLIQESPETLEDVIKNIKEVTYDDVKELVKDIYNPEWVVTEVIYPSKKS